MPVGVNGVLQKWPIASCLMPLPCFLAAEAYRTQLPRCFGVLQAVVETVLCKRGMSDRILGVLHGSVSAVKATCDFVCAGQEYYTLTATTAAPFCP